MARALLCATLALGLATQASAQWTLLFGISSKVQFESISVSTGKPVQQGMPLADELQTQGLTTMDDKNGIYYTVAFNDSRKANDLLALSTDTGKILSQTLIPTKIGGFVGVGTYLGYAPDEDKVIVVGPDAVTGNVTMFAVRSVTHKIQNLGRVGPMRGIPVLGGDGALDSTNKIFWFQYGLKDGPDVFIRLYGVDYRTGVQLNEIDGDYFMGVMKYHPTLDLIFGLGAKKLKNGTIEIALVQFSSKNTDYKVLASFPHYHTYSSNVGALDFRHNRIYFLMAPRLHASHPKAHLQKEHETVFDPMMRNGKDAQPLPMELVGIDLMTGFVKTNPQACANFPECPWSMAYQ